MKRLLVLAMALVVCSCGGDPPPLVDAGTDTGPIIDQDSVPALPDDDRDRLAARILQVEHELYPRVLRWAVEGRLTVLDGIARVVLKAGAHRRWYRAEGAGANCMANLRFPEKPL